MLRRNVSGLTKEGALETCGRKWRSTGRLTLGGSKAMKEQCSGFEVVRVCFTEEGDSVVYRRLLHAWSCYERSCRASNEFVWLAD